MAHIISLSRGFILQQMALKDCATTLILSAANETWIYTIKLIQLNYW